MGRHSGATDRDHFVCPAEHAERAAEPQILRPGLYAALDVLDLSVCEKDSDLIQAELEQLQATEAEFGSDLSRASWYMAQSLMSFYLGEDESSWDLIREADKVSDLPPLPSWASSTSHSGRQWDRLANWLPEIGPRWQSPQRASQRLSILLGCRHRAFARGG